MLIVIINPEFHRRLFLLNERKREEDERRKMVQPNSSRKRSRSPMLEVIETID